MANSKIPTTLTLLLFSTFIIAEFFLQGFAAQVIIPQHQDISHSSPAQSESHLQAVIVEWRNRNSRRMLIGSTAPTCTYNECRGCRFKCRAEQIPVDANDPINSAYHYKCVCHR